MIKIAITSLSTQTLAREVCWACPQVMSMPEQGQKAEMSQISYPLWLQKISIPTRTHAHTHVHIHTHTHTATTFVKYINKAEPHHHHRPHFSYYSRKLTYSSHLEFFPQLTSHFCTLLLNFLLSALSFGQYLIESVHLTNSILELSIWLFQYWITCIVLKGEIDVRFGKTAKLCFDFTSRSFIQPIPMTNGNTQYI